MNKAQRVLVIVVVIFGFVATNGYIWFYQDSQLKRKEDELILANQEYISLEGEYVELDERYTELDEEHGSLEGEYTELRESIPGMVEDAFMAGNDTGYEHGMEVGELIGYRSGYDVGHGDGYDVGHGDGYSQGHNIGIDIGYDSGYLAGGEAYAVGDFDGVYWFVRDPTYAEVKTFLHTDRTDKMFYSDEYRCAEFSYALRNNVRKLGYRSFGVYIRLEEGVHMIVGFNTTDHGMVFIEPQLDYFVKLEIGVSYWKTALQTSDKYRPKYDDTIVGWNIHW